MVSFPFDSRVTFDGEIPIYDRAVSSEPLRKLIRGLFTTGIMPNPSNNFQVSGDLGGMTIAVAPGFAVIDGGLVQEVETRILNVSAADSTKDRIDTVVLRWDENVDVRTADLYILEGTPASVPERPELTRTESIYEIGLADILVSHGSTAIATANITDTRYESERCGVVSSVSEWDTTTIYQQIQADLADFKRYEEADFIDWFNHIKGQLSEDAAGHLQNEIDDIINNGLFKPHLIIESDADCTVTIVKDHTTITVEETSVGVYECDIPEYGLWTIYSENAGGDIAETTIDVDTVKIYEISATHFRAFVTATYPSGGSCTLSKDGNTLTATSNPYTFTVHESGTYTLSMIANGVTFTDDIALSVSGDTRSVDIDNVINGSTYDTLNSVPVLIACAGIGDSNITTIAGLLANTTTLSIVIANNNAIDYLVRSTSFASSVTANQNAMTYIGASNYASDTLISNSTWRTSICNSSYMTKVLNASVPTMTSDTAPSGRAIASGEAYYADHTDFGMAYMAFRSGDTRWLSSRNGTAGPACWIGYMFPQKVKVCKATCQFSNYYLSSTTGVFFQGSNDGSSWTTLSSSFNPTLGSNVTTIFTNVGNYKYYRMYISAQATKNGSEGGQVYVLQFYGRKAV